MVHSTALGDQPGPRAGRGGTILYPRMGTCGARHPQPAAPSPGDQEGGMGDQEGRITTTCSSSPHPPPDTHTCKATAWEPGLSNRHHVGGGGSANTALLTWLTPGIQTPATHMAQQFGK